MIDQDPKKAAEEFMQITNCGSRWMSSQRVYCQLEAGHTGMCYSTAVSDEGEDCELWWSNEDLPVLEGDTNETSKDG